MFWWTLSAAHRVDDGPFSYFVRGRSLQPRAYFVRSGLGASHTLKRVDFYEADPLLPQPLSLPSHCTCTYSATAGVACVQNLVISSKERPLVSGTSQAT